MFWSLIVGYMYMSYFLDQNATELKCLEYGFCCMNTYVLIIVLFERNWIYVSVISSVNLVQNKY